MIIVVLGVQTALWPEAAALPVFSGFDIEPLQEIKSSYQ